MTFSGLKMDTADMLRHILAVYRLATREDIDAGLNWYPNAHDIVLQWADHFERSIANVACIVAALSPRCEWTRNLIIADDILHGLHPSISGATTENIRKACIIRDERHSDTLAVFPHGPKVRSFAANLAGNYQVVTVDTHAAEIAMHSCEHTLRIDTWKRYEPVAHAYTLAAKRISPIPEYQCFPPAFLQAITWHTWKRLNPPADKREVRRTW